MTYAAATSEPALVATVYIFGFLSCALTVLFVVTLGLSVYHRRSRQTLIKQIRDAAEGGISASRIRARRRRMRSITR